MYGGSIVDNAAGGSNTNGPYMDGGGVALDQAKMELMAARLPGTPPA